FSAYSLLEHMKHRQRILLTFMKNPESGQDAWPDAYWPEKQEPQSEEMWLQSIAEFEEDLAEMISLVQRDEVDLLHVHHVGKTLSWAAMTTFHHNAYTIRQIKGFGRQLVVWLLIQDLLGLYQLLFQFLKLARIILGYEG